MTFCTALAGRIPTTDGAPTQDGRGAKKDDEAEEFTRRVNEIWQTPYRDLSPLMTEAKENMREAQERINTAKRAPARTKAEDDYKKAESRYKYLVWLTWDSVPSPGEPPHQPDEQEGLIALNRRNAEFYAGTPAAFAPLEALPADPTPAAVNRRNATFWGK